MWGWYRVTVKHRASGQTRTWDVGCSSPKEAVSLGRIWFPEVIYSDHSAARLPGKPAAEVKAHA